MYGHMNSRPRHIVIAMLVSLGGITSACSAAESGDTAAAIVPATGLELLGPRRAAEMIEQLAPVILDVRTPDEYATGHIDGAILADVSDASFASRVAGLDRSATYFVYCRSGNRSAAATSFMIEQGFTSVFELDGGVIAWSNEDLPLVR